MAYRHVEGVVVMLHSLLILALNGVSGQLNALADLPQGNNPQYPLHRRVNGPWSRYGHFRDK